MEGLDVGDCAALTLPFVGNQADFMFESECDICDRDKDIGLSTGMPPTEIPDDGSQLPLVPPNDVALIREPRYGQVRLTRDEPADNVCITHGYPMGAVASTVTLYRVRLSDPPETRTVWGSSQLLILQAGASQLLWDTIWCNSKSCGNKRREDR